MQGAAAAASSGGGSGDTGSSSTGTGSSSNPPATLFALSTTTLDISATAAQPGPVAGFQIGIQTTATTQTKFYVKGTYTKHGIASITADSAGSGYTIQFQSPATLGVGTYRDSVTIEGCYDSACTQEVSNSPQTVSVTYTVTPGPGTLTSLSPDTVQAGRCIST